MASTIDKLYTKYAGRVQRYMENDAYYQYLLELIVGGKTTITQHNRVLDKSVDETWLTAIEAAIPAIHEIIARPRKFLKTNENLVPVEQAKRIGTETVRHLASHTQYISGVRGGMVYPGKVLTVENDESIDLYENRFVATLIRKVGEFIEKRTGAIFWDTGDEEQSILKVESNVEDDYEEISYKLEMIIKNKQTYLENDGSKMEIFKRIDRVRRMVSDFRASTFMQVMGNLPSVRSPIQRTNMITKNPHYRACYELWQFLERYDQVGYAIDVRETVLDFDEDYLFQMYGNVAMNYTVFKSLLEHDHRRITEEPKKRKTVKPKFIKQIVEQFVDDYDIPDVEIRQVIIEEVVKAQVEIDRRTREKATDRAKLASQKAKEKEKLAAQKAKEKGKAKLAAEKAKEKEKLAAQKAKEKERAKLAAEKAKEKEKLAAQKAKEREKAKLAAEKAKEKEKLAAQKAKEREKAKLAAEKAKEKEKLAAQKSKEKETAKAEAEKAKKKEPSAAPKAGEKGQKTPSAPKKARQSASAPKTAQRSKAPSIERASDPAQKDALPTVEEDPTRVMVGRPEFVSQFDPEPIPVTFIFPSNQEETLDSSSVEPPPVREVEPPPPPESPAPETVGSRPPEEEPRLPEKEAHPEELNSPPKGGTPQAPSPKPPAPGAKDLKQWIERMRGR